MKNNIICSATGFLHLGIGLVFLIFFETLLDLNTSFEFFVYSFSQIFNKGSQVIQRFLLVSLIFLCSIIVFVSFVTNFRYIKYVSYLFSFLIALLSCSNIYFFVIDKSLYFTSFDALLQSSLVHLFFVLLIVLFSFSPILSSNYKKEENKNDSLDSSFLEENDLETAQNISYFWHIHRIFSISLGFACLFVGLNVLHKPTAPAYIFFILLFGMSTLLWYQPKVGSNITSFFSILLMLIVIVLLILTTDMEEIERVHSLFELIILCLFFITVMGSIPFILLNKEARKEWKME